MALGDGADDVEPEARALYARGLRAVDSIEALENALQLRPGDARTVIPHAHLRKPVLPIGGGDFNMRVMAGVLDGIVDQIRYGGMDFIVVPQNGQRLGRLVLERARWDVVEDAGARHTLAHQLVETHWSQMRLAAGRSDAAGAENLFDCAEQAVAVGKDDAVELVALRFLDRARPERFDVKANGGDGRLQLVCDCVDERVMLLVTPDFPDEEDRVEHDARDDEGGEDDPEEEQNAGSPPPQRPADVQQYAEERHPDAERDEEGDGLFAAGPDHGPSLRH